MLGCGKCVTLVPIRLNLIGRRYSPAELLAVFLKYRSITETSLGGVTFSGGEPMLHPSYLSDILRLCKGEDLHTAVDTAGCVDFESFKQVMPWVDLFLYDIKLWDRDKHINATGVPNERILENLDRFTRAGADVYIRTPVITSFNYDPDVFHIDGFLDALTGRGGTSIHSAVITTVRKYGALAKAPGR